jgi:hypothetical protein
VRPSNRSCELVLDSAELKAGHILSTGKGKLCISRIFFAVTQTMNSLIYALQEVTKRCLSSNSNQVETPRSMTWIKFPRKVLEKLPGHIIPCLLASLICFMSNLFSFSRISVLNSASSGNNSCAEASVEKRVTSSSLSLGTDSAEGVHTKPKHFGLDVTEQFDQMMVAAHHGCYFFAAPVKCER